MVGTWRIVVVSVVSVVLVACDGGGGGSSGTTVANTSGTSAAPATTATAASAASTASTTDVADTILSTFGPDGPYDANRDARADIAIAQAIAASSDKMVLLDFGANWCPDCLVLDELYRDPAVAQVLSEHFVLVTIDIGEWDHNMDISDDYNHVADMGIPALVVLAADGTVLGDTKDGEFATASAFGPSDVLAYLESFTS